jgi:hypothetical protein
MPDPLRAPFPTLHSATNTLKSTYGPGDIDGLRRNGYESVKLHTVVHERKRFGEFVGRLANRLDRLGSRLPSMRRTVVVSGIRSAAAPLSR